MASPSRALEQVVSSNDKRRFSFSEDGRMIRANQGHSVEVELGYEPQTPPQSLYHGTVGRFLPSIREQGLIKGARHHVHLSADHETAGKVGERRGRAVIIEVEAGRMHADRFLFYRSENGVWLTEHVPARYLIF
jgi:putative RNA 2'-phosphotransferase